MEEALEGLNLKYYQCHKKVHATPMTLGQFKIESGRDQLLGSDDAPGYLVVYDRGTEEAYLSWSPKDKFEAGYAEIVE